MAAVLKDSELAQNIYSKLQAVSCPLLEGLYLQEADSKLQLLCTPSQLRTDILTWICSRINPNFANVKANSLKFKDPDILIKGMAALGHELMLCKEDNLGLIQGNESPRQQLKFFEQLLTVVPESKESPHQHCLGVEMLLDKLFTAENLPHLTQMLTPTLDPWPANITYLRKGSKGTKSSCQNPERKVADVAALLQSTRSALDELQSECDFLKNEVPSPAVFSPSMLHVAGRDLPQLMATFRHVYETDLRAWCNRDPPSFSTDTEVFHKVHELLQSCNTELEMLNEITEASLSVTEEVNKLQPQPGCSSQGEKHFLPDRLEELSRRYREFMQLEN